MSPLDDSPEVPRRVTATPPPPESRPKGLPPTNADGARAAARERDEAITRFLGLAGELVAPLASLVLSRTAREPWAGEIERASEGEWTRRVAEAAKVAGRDEIRDTLDGELREVFGQLTTEIAQLESRDWEGAVERSRRQAIAILRGQVNILQTLRYKVYGEFSNLSGWVGDVRGAPEDAEASATRRIMEAARGGARVEIRDKLDEEIRSLRYALPSCDSDEEAQSVRQQIDALQTFRYGVYGQPLDLEDEDTHG